MAAPTSLVGAGAPGSSMILQTRRSFCRTPMIATRRSSLKIVH
jgi:hypothetical protein